MILAEWIIDDASILYRLFTDGEIEQIKSIKLWDVIVNATDIQPGEVQKDLFYWREGNPCPQPEQLKASTMPKCDFLKGYDSFQVHYWNILHSFLQLKV